MTDKIKQNTISRAKRWALKDANGVCRKCKELAAPNSKQCLRHEYLARLSQIKVKYGLSKDAYEQMVKESNGRCAICQCIPYVKGLSRNDREKVSQTLVIDHDHETGIVRGLLCAHCNYGLGHFKHNPVLLERAKEYL